MEVISENLSKFKIQCKFGPHLLHNEPFIILFLLIHELCEQNQVFSRPNYIAQRVTVCF